MYSNQVSERSVIHLDALQVRSIKNTIGHFANEFKYSSVHLFSLFAWREKERLRT